MISLCWTAGTLKRVLNLIHYFSPQFPFQASCGSTKLWGQFLQVFIGKELEASIRPQQ
jgi:hypothetical protein